MNKQGVAIIVLLVLLVGTLGYMGYKYYQDKKIAEQQSLANYGYNVGYQQAVLDAAQLAVTCQAVPLRIGNTTINMIAVDCLQQAAQQQQQQVAQ